MKAKKPRGITWQEFIIYVAIFAVLMDLIILILTGP